MCQCGVDDWFSWNVARFSLQTPHLRNVVEIWCCYFEVIYSVGILFVFVAVHNNNGQAAVRDQSHGWGEFTRHCYSLKLLNFYLLVLEGPRVYFRKIMVSPKLLCVRLLLAMLVAKLIFRSLPGDDLVDWESGVSVRTSTNSFSDFHLIWCVGRPRPHMLTEACVTYLGAV